MATSLFGIGISGLHAAQAGLVTTEHNITNANTPGYRRQEIVQSPALPQSTGSGYFGSGVVVDTVKRAYSQFLEGQLLQTQTTGSYLDAYYAQVRQINNMLADPQAGLSPALQEFFNNMQELASNPSSVPVRQGVLSTATTLSDRFNTLYARMKDLRSGVNSQLTTTVAEINSYAAQIASLNDQITLAVNSGSGTRQPNDMLDQRDQLISELNQRVKVSTVAQTNGSLNVFIGNGQPLVVDKSSFALSTTQSPEDPDNLNVSYGAGSLNQATLTGGNLGALLEFRSGILETAQNSLGRVAAALELTINAQHTLGVDLSGAMGGNFFNSITPVVQENSNNTSGVTISAQYSATAARALTTSSYRLTYNTTGSTYTVTDLATNTSSTVAAASIGTAISGLTLTPSGTPSNGETFLVLPTRYAAKDMTLALNNTSQIAAAAPATTSANQANTGAASISPGSVDSTFTTGALGAAVTLTYNSTTGEFTASPAPAAILVGGVATTSPFTYTSGATISFGGASNTAISFVITGTPATGDTFTISPNFGTGFTGASDGRNALLLANQQTSSIMVNNSAGTAATTSYQGAFSQLVSEVGNKTREYEVRSKAQSSLIEQAKQEQQSISGVNLDEEAANLLRYQQSYQAAGKAMQIASTLFDTLLGMGR